MTFGGLRLQHNYAAFFTKQFFKKYNNQLYYIPVQRIYNPQYTLINAGNASCLLIAIMYLKLSK